SSAYTLLSFPLLRPPPPSPLFPYTTLFRSTLTTTQVGGLAASQLGALTTTQVGGFTTTDLAAITTTQLGGFTSSQLGALSTTQRSEEHTSELQSLTNLVCRLLLEKKKHPPP